MVLVLRDLETQVMSIIYILIDSLYYMLTCAMTFFFFEINKLYRLIKNDRIWDEMFIWNTAGNINENWSCRVNYDFLYEKSIWLLRIDYWRQCGVLIFIIIIGLKPSKLPCRK